MVRGKFSLEESKTIRAALALEEHYISDDGYYSCPKAGDLYSKSGGKGRCDCGASRRNRIRMRALKILEDRLQSS